MSANRTPVRLLGATFALFLCMAPVAGAQAQPGTAPLRHTAPSAHAHLHARFPITHAHVGERGGGAPNDACDSAVVQAVPVPGDLTLFGDNTLATDSEGFGYNTVWEAFVITDCAQVQVDLCGTSPVFGNYFTDLVIGCTLDSVIGASSVTDCGDGNVALAFGPLEPGTYHVPILMEPGVAEGPYTLHITTLPCTAAPLNDACENAVPEALFAGGALFFNGDNTTATAAGDGVFDSAPTVWHAFTTTECLDVTVGYCATAPPFGDFWVDLATDCPATAFITPTAHDFYNGCGNPNLSMFFNDLPPGTYWIPVLRSALATGPYAVNVEATACDQPPVNDSCSAVPPVDLALNATIVFEGSTTNATTGGDAEPGSLLDLNGQPVVWHAFSTAECMALIVRYCGTSPVFTAWYAFLAVTCPADDQIIFPDGYDVTACGDGNVSAYYAELPSGTYHLPVLMDPFEAIGEYQIEVISDSCLTTVVPTLPLRQPPAVSSDGATAWWWGPEGEHALMLTDMTGRTVWSGREHLGYGTSVTGLSALRLRKGAYVLSVASRNEVVRERLVLGE